MSLLEVKNLGISFGGLRAVDGFHISIEKGQLYGLIGPNGAGKTTVFNMLTGVYTPNDGSITLDGVDITGKDDRYQQSRDCPYIPEYPSV
jgi:branched-chain amino acid transport system ATP-binding protein